MAAAVVMTGWLLLIDTVFGAEDASGSVLADIFILIISIVSGATVYGFALYLTGLPELQMIVGKFRERLSGAD